MKQLLVKMDKGTASSIWHAEETSGSGEHDSDKVALGFHSQITLLLVTKWHVHTVSFICKPDSTNQRDENSNNYGSDFCLVSYFLESQNCKSVQVSLNGNIHQIININTCLNSVLFFYSLSSKRGQEAGARRVPSSECIPQSYRCLEPIQFLVFESTAALQ